MPALFLTKLNSIDQLSFAELEYENKKCKTRRDKFLERIDALVP